MCIRDRDQPLLARRTPQVPVVHADQVAVGGQPYVALQRLGAGVEGGDVRAQGVLGVVVAGAPMRDDLGSHDIYGAASGLLGDDPVHDTPAPVETDVVEQPAVVRDQQQRPVVRLEGLLEPVSYTHLTLPTNREV